MNGVIFVGTAVYLTLAVAFVLSLADVGFERTLGYHTARRWGKFLLLLVGLGIVVQVLTWIQGA